MILAVDDNPQVHASLKVAFPNFSLVSAKNGEEALSILKKPHVIDVVILDVKMDGMSGLETLKRIRELQPALPVIMMTGFGTRDVLITALQNGANDYVDKPFDIKDVRKKIEKQLEKYKHDRVHSLDSIERTKRFVHRNFERDLSLNQAAEVASLSPKYLSRKFKKETKQSFTEYRVGIKMGRAKQLLTSTTMNVGEIADEIGYESPESFMKMFKRLLGCTPSEYRNSKAKKAIALAFFMFLSGLAYAASGENDEKVSRAQQFGIEVIPYSPLVPKAVFADTVIPSAQKTPIQETPKPKEFSVSPAPSKSLRPLLNHDVKTIQVLSQPAQQAISTSAPTVVIDKKISSPQIPYAKPKIEAKRMASATIPTVFSSRRMPVQYSKVPEKVTIVTAEEIRDLPAHNAAEVLEYVSDVDIDPRTRFGHFTPLSIQGSDSRHVLVMVDGIPFNNQLSGQADILTALPAKNIQQIEIVKGSGSSVWGSAAGGVIQIITKPLTAHPRPTGESGMRVSEYGTQSYDFNVEGSAREIRYGFWGDYMNSGGARPETTDSREDVLQKKLFGKLTANLSDTVLATSTFGYSDAKTHEGVFPSFAFRNEIPYTTRYGEMALEVHPSDAQDMRAALKLNRQHIRSTSFFSPDDTPFSSASSHDNYYGGELKHVFRINEQNSLVSGYDISHHILQTTFMDQSQDVLIHAPYTNYQWSNEIASVTGGVRYDINEEYGEAISPSIGGVLGLPFLGSTSLRGNVSRGFNAPPLLWRYFEDTAPGFTANNPDIAPEIAQNYQAGIETKIADKLSMSLGVYRTRIEDAIATTVREDGFFIKSNFDEFIQKGFEWDSVLSVRENLHLTFNANVNDVTDKATKLEVRGRGTAKVHYRTGVGWEPVPDYKLAVMGKYWRWDSLPDSQANDAKFIFDARMSYVFKKLVGALDTTVYVDVFNLTNSKYWADINLPSPPRYFEGGLSFRF